MTFEQFLCHRAQNHVQGWALGDFYEFGTRGECSERDRNAAWCQRIEDDCHSDARSNDPVRKLGQRPDRRRAGGALRCEHDYVVFGQLRVPEQWAKYQRMRIAKQPIELATMGPPCETAALANRQLTTEQGVRFVGFGVAERGGDRVAAEDPQQTVVASLVGQTAQFLDTRTLAVDDEHGDPSHQRLA
jgi:hypothetical protein